MATKDDLENKIQSLSDQLSRAKKSLADILCGEFDLKVGDVVKHYGTKLTISSIRMRYENPVAWGKKTLKSGELGNQEFEVYGNYTKYLDK